MVYQKTMSEPGPQTGSNGRHDSPPGVTTGVGEFLHDVICLAELQGQLLATDLHEGKSRAMLPVILLAATPLLLLGALPVLLMGVAWLLHSTLEWSEAASLLATAGAAIVVAAVMGWIGWKRLSGAVSVLTRSRQELRENLRWLKGALRPHA
jgi:hypothetical protein